MSARRCHAQKIGACGGTPLLEEFVLAIDPYPRAPGVEFAAPVDAEPRPESPFAVLKALKDRG